MKRVLFLLAVFFISSSFESKPPGGPINPPSGPPVIIDPNPQPVGPTVMCIFKDPNNPTDSFNAWVSVSGSGFSVQLSSSRYIARVGFKNLTSGEFHSVQINSTTDHVAGYFTMTNGHWRIEIVTVGGTHYVTDIMVNSTAFGPLVPCDWIDEGCAPGGF